MSDAPVERAAEVLAIGDELLFGHGLDTNSAEIARALYARGFEVHRHVTVGDQLAELECAIRESCERSALVVATGGLGPTEDDRTREAAARAAGAPLAFDAASWERIQRLFRAQGREPPASNRNQAWLPRGARVLENRFGTAPGFVLEIAGALFVALPGVPREMRGMLEEHVLPLVAERFARGGAFAFRQLHVLGLHEAELGERLADLMRNGREPRVGVTASFGQLTVRIAARGGDAAEAAQRAEETAAVVRQRLGTDLLYEGEDPLHLVVARRLLEDRVTFALAESCTGGLLAARLTEVAGISAVFRAGYVTYADAAKVHDLGVPAALLAEHGAVSTEVAAAMAEGAARRAGARLAVAITGIAGPGGGTPEKPVGTVCFSTCRDGDTRAWRRRFVDLGRRFVRERAIREALAAMLRAGQDTNVAARG